MRISIESHARSALRSHFWRGLTIVPILGSLLLSSCATSETGKKTQWGAIGGALVGAAAGALIDQNDPGRGALIGAAVGGAAGAAAGYAWGAAQERQVRTPAQIEQSAQQQGAVVLAEPKVELKNVTVTPQAAMAGQAVNVKTVMVAYGPGVAPPKGKLHLYKEGTLLTTKDIESKTAGEVEVTNTLKLPDDAASGEYEVVIQIDGVRGPLEERRTFTVA